MIDSLVIGAVVAGAAGIVLVISVVWWEVDEEVIGAMLGDRIVDVKVLIGLLAGAV